MQRSVVINRADLPGKRETVEQTAHNAAASIAAEIKLDNDLLAGYLQGKPVVELFPDAAITGIFLKMADHLTATSMNQKTQARQEQPL